MSVLLLLQGGETLRHDESDHENTDSSVGKSRGAIGMRRLWYEEAFANSASTIHKQRDRLVALLNTLFFHSIAQLFQSQCE